MGKLMKTLAVEDATKKMCPIYGISNAIMGHSIAMAQINNPQHDEAFNKAIETLDSKCIAGRCMFWQTENISSGVIYGRCGLVK